MSRALKLSIETFGIPEPDLILFAEMADGFDAHSKTLGLKQKSINCTLARNSEAMAHIGTAPWFWSIDNVESYARHLVDDRKLKKSSLRKYLGEIKSFNHYLFKSVKFKGVVRTRYKVEIQDLSLEDIAPHKDEEEGVGARAMAPSEIDLFFDTLWLMIDEAEEKKRLGVKSGEMPLYRDLAMFTSIYHFGLRCHEGQGLRVSKFSEDPTNPQFGKFGMVQVLGKAPKGASKPKRSIPMTFENTHLILGAYMDTVRPYFTASIDPESHWDNVRTMDYMFFSERGRPISISSIEARFTKIAHRAGFADDERITVHSLRKSFATHNYLRGMRLDTLRQLLGHKHLSTTQIYLDLTDRHVQDDIRKVQKTSLDQALNEDKNGQ